MTEYYNQPISEVFSALGTSEKGLSEKEAAKLLAAYGPNELKEGKKISAFKVFLSQFTDFIVWILIAAVAISMFLGEWIESIVILIILIINAVIGFLQEYRAEKAIEALKKLAGLKADVLRDGQKKTIDAAFLVPGDIIFLEVGDKIPADSRLIEEHNLSVMESSLTGESTPVKKEVRVLKKAALADRINMVFSSTIIVRGRATAVVTATGMQTEIGRIATLIQAAEEELTPLQMKLNQFSKRLGYGVVVIAAIVFIATILKGGEILEMFKTAVSLAVAAIPEGLPAVVALSLALGVQRMIKKNALVRKLPSVETLGSTTVICSDKTGTLTKDQMTVRKIFVDGAIAEVTGEGYSTNGAFSVEHSHDLLTLLRIGAVCNDATLNKDGSIVGDPTEVALIVSAAKGGLLKEEIEKKLPRVDEIPFDSERKRMTTIHEIGSKRIMYTKGAPDIILKLCTKILKNGKIIALTPSERKIILSANEEFAQNALRVLGFAFKQLAQKEKPDEKELVFVGLQAMIDPPREEAKGAVKACKDAGIRVIMITGDHKLTAVAIAKELGIDGKAITGEELDAIENLEEIVEDIAIYARVSPEHKIRIVEALRKRNHIAAMTGDGVNDAPALKKADIGIAMGKTGTDVAREASKMILTDDNFASIVNAVEEGRGIYDNIRKFIFFLLSCNVSEVLIIFIAVMIGLKLPLVAIQILWMNLITDGLPALALGVEPRDKDIMKRKPRHKNEGVLNKDSLARMLTVSVVITAGVLGVFIWALMSKGWTWGASLEDSSPIYVYALTMAFTTLVVFELFNAFNAKSERKSAFVSGLLSNKYLIGAVIMSLLLQLMVIYTPLSSVFDTTPLSMA
ncbi:MAG: calcium-transporting P-type ATPase, PMR1-type, partial [Candidatus Woesearchaeota archaeon]